MEVGLVIGGSFEKIKIRLKEGVRVGVGDFVYIEGDEGRVYYKITDVKLSSEHEEKELEEMAGEIMEGLRFLGESERFYKIAEARQIGIIRGKKVLPYRRSPSHFSKVFLARGEDLREVVGDGIKIGKLRFGSEVTEIDVGIPKIEKVISHHILISAATGKGKSNLAKVLLKGILEYGGNISVIVFDPHKEYWGGEGLKGLRNLPSYLREKVFYFTLNPRIEGGYGTLKVNPNLLEPSDFYGIVDFTEAQMHALEMVYRKWKQILMTSTFQSERYGGWVELLVKNPEAVARGLKRYFRNPATFYILRRKIMFSLDLIETEEGIVGEGPFDFDVKNDLFAEIQNLIRKRGIIILDTSAIGDFCERILASAILSRLFRFYKYLRQNEIKKWEEMPYLLVLFEEAPRFIGKSVIERGNNIFERVAREGRKFKVGLCAITQMPSLIPREILSQMNTKIILGTPAQEDRKALIESSSQNIEEDSKEIQVLDVGEAIITSPFISFPYSVKIYNFEEIMEEGEEEDLEIGVG